MGAKQDVVARLNTSLSRRECLAGVAGLALATWEGTAARGQAPAAPPAASSNTKLAKPEDVLLECSDGVILKATYFASNLGKAAVPVILVHDFQQDRHVFDGLALYLQSQGYAVLAADLRGHGESTTIRGERVRLNISTFGPKQYTAMVTQDMEAMKRFLVDKNNAGALNIDKLSIVGAGMGTIIASDFAVRDWQWPVLTTGKQGQDVKALVLISPVWNFKNLKLTDAMRSEAYRRDLSFLIIMGSQDKRAVDESERLFLSIKKDRPSAANPADRTLFLDRSLKTTLQGTKLLGEKSLNLEKRIATFLQARAVNQNHIWAERKRPLSS